MAELALALGDRVTFARHLVRKSRPPTLGTAWRKEWEDLPFPYLWMSPAEPLAGVPTEGLVIGVRHLTDGKNSGGWDEPVYYHPTKTFRACLVAWDLYRRPALVLPEHLHRVPQ